MTARPRRRWSIAAAVAVLFLGACGGGVEDDAGNAVYGDAAGGSPGRDTTTTGKGATATTRASVPSEGGGGAGATGGRSTSTTTARSGSGSGGSGGTSAGRPVTVSGPPGSYARSLLRASEGGTILLDVLTQAGAELRAGTLEHVVNVLERESGKQVSVATTEFPGTQSEWTADEITSVADTRSDNEATTERHVVHLLAVHGHYEAPGTLGIAVRGDVVAVFTDDVDGAATPLVPARTIEEAVATHEIGHLMGLVDLALDTNRGDPEHPGHSKSHASVMYWAIESSLVAQVLGGPPSTEFDNDDRADLAKLRAGA